MWNNKDEDVFTVFGAIVPCWLMKQYLEIDGWSGCYLSNSLSLPIVDSALQNLRVRSCGTGTKRILSRRFPFGLMNSFTLWIGDFNVDIIESAIDYFEHQTCNQRNRINKTEFLITIVIQLSTLSVSLSPSLYMKHVPILVPASTLAW